MGLWRWGRKIVEDGVGEAVKAVFCGTRSGDQEGSVLVERVSPVRVVPRCIGRVESKLATGQVNGCRLLSKAQMEARLIE